MSFKLYYYYICPYCKPIYYFVNANKLPHEPIHLDLMKGEQRSPDYLKINPFGKVPAIVEEDGFILFESSTLLKYLCNTREVPDHWYPKDPRKRSQVDMFFDWFQVATKSFARYFYSKLPHLPTPKQFQGLSTDAKEDLETTLKDLEKIFLRDRKYLAGDEISLADIQIIFFFGNLELVEFDLSGFPALKEWKERVLSTSIRNDYNEYIEIMVKRLEAAKNAQNTDTK